MNKRQMSDSLIICILLALSGGGMDAYSYLCRDYVFANAQTGNMVLFGVNLISGDFMQAFKYFIPVIAFTIGIILSDVIRAKTISGRWHWRQSATIIEFLILLGVAFIPQSANMFANAMISFACGVQVESFRTVKGNAIATTMCIGNLRSGTYYFDKYVETKDKTYRNKAFIYYVIILFFVIGAVIESIVIRYIEDKAIILSAFLLILVCILMTVVVEEKCDDDSENFVGD